MKEALAQREHRYRSGTELFQALRNGPERVVVPVEPALTQLHDANVVDVRSGEDDLPSAVGQAVVGDDVTRYERLNHVAGQVAAQRLLELVSVGYGESIDRARARVRLEDQ